jgi:hypothetical protein
MRNLVFSISLVLTTFSVLAQNAGFKAMLRDKPDPTKAILVVTSNHYGGLYVTSGNKVHGTPATNSKFDINGELPGIRCYYVVPGEYDFTAYAPIIGLGSYPNFSTFSKSFPFSGFFTLEAGKAYHIGYVNANIPTTRQKGSIMIETSREQTCTFEITDDKLIASKEHLKRYYPKVLNSVKGEIGQVSFTQGHKICPSGNVIFDENFTDNSRGWKTADDGIHKSYITSNSLIIENNGTDSCVLTLPVKIPKGFEIILETTWTGGDDNKGFGLILGNSERKCFKFTISGNGYFSIQRWAYIMNKMWVSPFALDWRKYDFINTGAGAKNVIRVQRMGIDRSTSGMFVIYVNDVLVARNIFFIDPMNNIQQLNNKGVIGVYSYGKQDVAFNRLIYSEL